MKFFDMHSEVCNQRAMEERILGSLPQRLIEIVAVAGGRGSGTPPTAALNAMRCPRSHSTSMALMRSRAIAVKAQRGSFAQYEHAHGLRLIGEFFWLQGRRRGTGRVFDPVGVEEG
jgi:hypothetical protein